MKELKKYFGVHLYIQKLSTAMLQSFASHDISRGKNNISCTVVADLLMGGPNSLGGQSGERGGNLSPYADTFHFLKGGAGYQGLGLHPS